MNLEAKMAKHTYKFIVCLLGEYQSKYNFVVTPWFINTYNIYHQIGFEDISTRHEFSFFHSILNHRDY